jgi:putative transposase
MKFIDAHDFPAGLVLRVLGIAESTYYDWRARRVSPSRRELDAAALLEQILEDPRRARVRRHLRLPAGVAGAAPPGRAGRAQARGATHAHPRAAGRAPAPGLAPRLDPVEPAPRRRAGPGRARLPGHRTEPAVGGRPDPAGHRQGRAVAGQRARRVRQPHRRLGHRPARHDHAGAHRAQPRAALAPGAGRGLIFHSDKGAQYTALRFTQRLVDAGVAPSTGSTGDSFDNALAENLWSTIKVELMYWPGTTFATRVEAEHALLRYIDGWYNPRRIQAGLGGLSPEEYEDAYHRGAPDPDR